SRCHAIVYDIFQHICHYFIDDGTENAILSHGTIYFRVTSKQCLDNSLKSSSSTYETVESLPIANINGQETNYFIRTTIPTTFTIAEALFESSRQQLETTTAALNHLGEHVGRFSAVVQKASSSRRQTVTDGTVEHFYPNQNLAAARAGALSRPPAANFAHIEET
uniref:FHA domain-containing protein n=1 Tax=Parascaris univalens TaxID=6257 RepID=A0A915CFI6_PARUN